MVSDVREILESAIKSCARCQTCSSYCQLLEELGDLTPYEVAEQVLTGHTSEKVLDFISRCNLCGLCGKNCPAENDIPAIVIAARQVLAANGTTDLNLYRAMWVDHDWNAFTIYRNTYQISYSDLIKTRCDTLFFAGCALSSFAPELTRAATGWLSESFGEVGLLLMCCGIPLAQIGIAERAERHTGLIWRAVKDSTARRIIVACPGCYHHLRRSKAHRNIEILSLYQLMADAGVRLTVPNHRKFTVHDSCPDREGEMGRSVRKLLGKYKIVEMAHHGPATLCCGSGGIVAMIDEGLCTRRAEARLAEFYNTGADICVTYCMSCALRLSSVAGPGKVRHILELVFNQPLDYAHIQHLSEAMWQGEQGKYNLKRLENSSLQNRLLKKRCRIPPARGLGVSPSLESPPRLGD